MAASDVMITGLSPSDPVPGVYPEIRFAQGPVAGNSSVYEAVILANKLSTGSGTVDTVVYGPDSPDPIQTEQQIIDKAGAGSEAHRMFRRFTKFNLTTPLRFVFVTESAGAKATYNIVFATTATGVGSVRIWVGDEFCDAPISTGDTVTVIGDAAADAINANTHWGVTAVNTAGSVAVTAKQKGPRGNQIRVMASIQSLGSIGTTVTPTTDTPLAGGTTADSNTTALATIASKRYYYIVSAAGDATQLGALATQVNTMAIPVNNKRQRVVAGAVGTLSASNTIATGLNNPRVEIVWSEKSPRTEAELAAGCAGIYALGEANTNNPRTSFVGYGNAADTATTWDVPAPRDASAHPTRASISSAILNGLSPIGVNANGTTYLVDRVTTRTLSGSTADYRIRDSHKVTICDYVGDEGAAKLTLQFGGKRIGDDPPQGGKMPGPEVVTPSMVRLALLGLIDKFDANDLLQDTQKIKDEMVVQRATSPRTRMDIIIPLRPIDNLKQIGFLINQVA